MKILFLSRYQNKVNRGAEVFVLELSKRLRENYQVDIFAGSDSDSLSKILKGNYDVVFPINGGMQSFKASIGRFIKNYKLIISGQAGIGRGEIWNIAVCRPDIYVALTDYMAKWVNKWTFGTKVIKIPNGVDLSKFKPEGEKIDLKLQRPIILSVGALSWYKHHDRLVRAVREMEEGSVFIVGDGEDKEKLENLGKKLLGDRFKIANFKYEDMPKVYRSVDLLSLPSWDREAFGIVYLEAMASGLGVVAPDDAVRHEIIGDAGLFIDVSDAQKYADVIDKALKKDWSKIARRQAEKFSWDKIAKQYEQVLKTL